jgi:hypothetical protein
MPMVKSSRSIRTHSDLRSLEPNQSKTLAILVCRDGLATYISKTERILSIVLTVVVIFAVIDMSIVGFGRRGLVSITAHLVFKFLHSDSFHSLAIAADNFTISFVVTDGELAGLLERLRSHWGDHV